MQTFEHARAPTNGDHSRLAANARIQRDAHSRSTSDNSIVQLSRSYAVRCIARIQSIYIGEWPPPPQKQKCFEKQPYDEKHMNRGISNEYFGGVDISENLWFIEM